MFVLLLLRLIKVKSLKERVHAATVWYAAAWQAVFLTARACCACQLSANLLAWQFAIRTSMLSVNRDCTFASLSWCRAYAPRPLESASVLAIYYIPKFSIL